MLPCRGFTPILKKSYTDHLRGKGLEIVFASADKDDASFQEYYGQMPWLAIPFSRCGVNTYNLFPSCLPSQRMGWGLSTLKRFPPRLHPI